MPEQRLSVPVRVEGTRGEESGRPGGKNPAAGAWRTRHVRQAEGPALPPASGERKNARRGCPGTEQVALLVRTSCDVRVGGRLQVPKFKVDIIPQPDMLAARPDTLPPNGWVDVIPQPDMLAA